MTLLSIKLFSKKLVKLNLALTISLVCIACPVLAASNKINWQPCSDDPTFQCGELTVPKDYKNPNAGFIKLPVTIHKATKNQLGTILFNFGGPWYDDVSNLHGLTKELSDSIKNNFDLVSFTPRGAGPNPIICYSEKIDLVHENMRALNLTYLNSEQGAQQVYDLILKNRDLCQYDSSYQFASTKNTIQDLDEFRKELNLEKINFFGGSYGTRLGLAYLVYYPQHIHNMVLDAIVVPNNDALKFLQGVAPAIENTLQAFFEMCVKAENKCPLYHGSIQETRHVYQKLLSQAETTGIPTSSKFNYRPLSAEMLTHLIISALGSQETWPTLANFLNQSYVTNNADLLMNLYVLTTGYDPSSNTFKKYNDSATFDAVYCMDYFLPKELQTRQNWLLTTKDFRTQYPLTGGSWATYYAKECIAWPGLSQPLLPDTVEPIISSQPTVLLVSNEFDPITSLKWSNEVSDYLNKIHVTHKILIWQGAGHISYHANAPLNGCIDNNVDQFFVTGKLPKATICSDKINPFENTNSVDIVKLMRQSLTNRSFY